jgi:hypothetical protein
MRVLAQRVRLTPNGQEGINAFSYWHGGLFWEQLPPPQAPVVRGAVLLAIPPGPMPRVTRSSLNVLAPDATSSEEFWAGVEAFADALASVGGQLPKTGTFGRVSVTFEVDSGLVPQWWDELERLATAAAAVGPEGRR